MNRGMSVCTVRLAHPACIGIPCRLMWHDSAVPGWCALQRRCFLTLQTTKLRPSTRRRSLLAGAASERLKANISGSPAVRFSQCHDESQAQTETQRRVGRTALPSSAVIRSVYSGPVFLGSVCWYVGPHLMQIYVMCHGQSWLHEGLKKTLHWLYWLYLLNLRQQHLFLTEKTDNKLIWRGFNGAGCSVCHLLSDDIRLICAKVVKEEQLCT